jgi:hypothetical protein
MFWGYNYIKLTLEHILHILLVSYVLCNCEKERFFAGCRHPELQTKNVVQLIKCLVNAKYVNCCTFTRPSSYGKSLWPLRKSVQLSKTRIISSFIGAVLAFMNLDLYFEWVSGLKSPMIWIRKTLLKKT